MDDLIANVRKGKFLILGRAGVDFYPTPAGTKTELAKSFEAHLGGSSANVAVCLTQLLEKRRVWLLTCVSDDAVGRLALNELRDYGIHTDYVRILNGDKEARISLAVVETRVDDHQSVIYRNNAADLKLDIPDVLRAMAPSASVEIKQSDYNMQGQKTYIEKKFRISYDGEMQIGKKNTMPPDFSTLVITGTALAAEPSRSATLLSLQIAKDQGLSVIMDIDFRPYTWESPSEATRVYRAALKYCDVVVGNDAEFLVVRGSGVDADAQQGNQPQADVYAQRGSGVDARTSDLSITGGVAEASEKGTEEAKTFARSLVENRSLSCAVFKMGSKGSLCFMRKSNMHPDYVALEGEESQDDVETQETGIFDIDPLSVLKPTGSGDAFLGALIAGLARGETVKQAVIEGTGSAAMVVTGVGCAPAMPKSIESLREFMNTVGLKK